METFSALLALCAGNSPVPVNSPHKGQWRGAMMFSLICTWISDWVNNREAGDLRRHRGHYDVNVMMILTYSYSAIPPSGTFASEILIKIKNFSFTKMQLNTSSTKSRPFCPGGDELTSRVHRNFAITFLLDKNGNLTLRPLNNMAAKLQTKIFSANLSMKIG